MSSFFKSIKTQYLSISAVWPSDNEMKVTVVPNTAVSKDPLLRSII